MISIIVKDLDKRTLYPQVLRISEYVCEEFQLSKYFGIISMANQSVVDYILECAEEILLEIQININVSKICVFFISKTPIFDHILANLSSNSLYHHDFTYLSNNFKIKSDNKEIMYTFHVKPHIKTERYLPVEVLQHNQISI